MRRWLERQARDGCAAFRRTPNFFTAPNNGSMRHHVERGRRSDRGTQACRGTSTDTAEAGAGRLGGSLVHDHPGQACRDHNRLGDPVKTQHLFGRDPGAVAIACRHRHTPACAWKLARKAAGCLCRTKASACLHSSDGTFSHFLLPSSSAFRNLPRRRSRRQEAKATGQRPCKKQRPIASRHACETPSRSPPDDRKFFSHHARTHKRESQTKQTTKHHATRPWHRHAQRKLEDRQTGC
jgi:hypothetical protein